MSDLSATSPSFVRKSVPWAIGLCFGMLFVSLMVIRLGIWSDKKNVLPPQPVETMEKESWMDIYRHNEKIGYSHRRLSNKRDGFELLENTRLRLNLMGMIQDMQIRTSATLNRNYSLASFTFDLRSGAFDFKVHGSVQNNVLRIFTEERETRIPLNEPIFLLSSISNPATLNGVPPDITRTFDVFDPSSLGRRQVRVTREGHETLHISGKRVETDRFSMETMGITQSAWITSAGEVVQETGPMGIRLIKSDAKKSAQGFDDAKSTDLTESFSIASNIPLMDQDKITRLRMSIHGAHDAFFLNGGRQTLKDSILTIVKESLSAPPEKQPMAEIAPFLDPSAQIRSDHPMIRHKAAQLVSKSDPPLAKARKIMTWIFEHIEKRPVLSIPDAVKTLENGMGDCNEHAVLFAALARAAGVPSRIEAGLVHMEGRFYYHAWNVIYAEGWITVDALMGQMPADVSHVRLIRGDIADQLDIIHAIDRLHLRLLDIVK